MGGVLHLGLFGRRNALEAGWKMERVKMGKEGGERLQRRREGGGNAINGGWDLGLQAVQPCLALRCPCAVASFRKSCLFRDSPRVHEAGPGKNVRQGRGSGGER